MELLPSRYFIRLRKTKAVNLSEKNCYENSLRIFIQMLGKLFIREV